MTFQRYIRSSNNIPRVRISLFLKLHYDGFIDVVVLWSGRTSTWWRYPPSVVYFRIRFILVFFWAPTWKWGISVANIADITRPPETLSYPQQCGTPRTRVREMSVFFPTAIAATGLIWSRYSMVITPVNYNLLAVNAFMAVTGLYQLYRKTRSKRVFFDWRSSSVL